MWVASQYRDWGILKTAPMAYTSSEKSYNLIFKSLEVRTLKFKTQCFQHSSVLPTSTALCQVQTWMCTFHFELNATFSSGFCYWLPSSCYGNITVCPSAEAIGVQHTWYYFGIYSVCTNMYQSVLIKISCTSLYSVRTAGTYRRYGGTNWFRTGTY